MGAHGFGIVVDGCQRADCVGNVTGNNRHDLRRIAGNIRGADAVIHFHDRYRQPVRRIQRHIYVMHAFEFERLAHVDFDDDLFGALHIRCGVTHRSSRDDVALFGDRAGFDDGDVDFAAQITVTGHLRRMAQMQVGISDRAAVDLFADRVIGLVRKPAGNPFYFGQRAVQLFADGGAGPKIDLERVGFHPLRQGQGHSLRIAGRGESADAEVHARFDQGRCCFGRGDLGLQRAVADTVFDFNHAVSPPQNMIIPGATPQTGHRKSFLKVT